MTMDEQRHFMSLALEASAQALPDCAPNPPVGCVLVKNNVVVSTGYTRQPGGHHAEADALSRWPDSLKGVSAYVTLEPCSFHGRTPACAEALISRGIDHVYVGITDPDPRNNGKGIAMLREAGVEVTEGIMADAVLKFLSQYLNKS